MRKKNSEFKLVVDLEKDGLHLVIPTEDTLLDQCPNNQIVLKVKERVLNN